MVLLQICLKYGKCSKMLNTLLCSQIKCGLSGTEFTKKDKLLNNIGKSEDPDQTASEEAVWSWSALFVLAFRQATRV